MMLATRIFMANRNKIIYSLSEQKLFLIIYSYYQIFITFFLYPITKITVLLSGYFNIFVSFQACRHVIAIIILLQVIVANSIKRIISNSMQPKTKPLLETTPSVLYPISINQPLQYPNSSLLLKSKNYLEKLDNRINEVIPIKNNNNQANGGRNFGINGNYCISMGNANQSQRKNDTNIVRSIDDMAKSIRYQIENKIQQNFGSIINQQKRLDIFETVAMQPKQKQQAVKNLLRDYWQKQSSTPTKIPTTKQKTEQKQNFLPKLHGPIEQSGIRSQSFLTPQFENENNKNRKKAIVSSLNVKTYEKNKLKEREKERQREILKKHKEEKILAYLYSYMVHVVDYKVQNDTPQFLLFQKINYKKWDQIEDILNNIEKFTKKYEIKYCTLDLQKVMQLIESKSKNFEKGNKISSAPPTDSNENQHQNTGGSNKKVLNNGYEIKGYTLHQLLGCLEDSEQISINNQKKAGIRFYGNKGKLRAIIKIQAAWRGCLTFKKTKQLQTLVKKVIKIQKAYRIYRKYMKTKQKIAQRCQQKYNWFKAKQSKFSEQYRMNELTKSIKYELHICSDSNNEWQRVSNEKYIQKHSTYITRIFKAFVDNSNKQKCKQYELRQTRIVFVTAFPISSQICNYYFKLLELGGANDFRSRITFLAVDQCQQLLHKIPLARVLYYCPKIIKKLKDLFKNQYAYLVPSNPSPDYIQLCHALDIPLYSTNPQSLSYLQTNSGCKDFLKELDRAQNKDKSRITSTSKNFTENGNQNQSNFQRLQSQLPYAKNIYSLAVLVNELALLIQTYPYISKWILKIDNEHSSRGLAYLQINKVIPKKMIKFIRKCFSTYTPTPSNPICPQIRQLSKQILSILHQAFTDSEYSCLTVINQSVYRSNNQYLNFYFANGGIIQADISFKGNSSKNLKDQADVEALCFCIEIEPDFEWKFVCQFRKIVRKMRVVSCYYEQELIQPPIQIQSAIKELIKRKHFGYFVLDFLKPLNNQNPTLNSIKCYLDSFSSSCFLHQFISKQSNMLFLPYIPHDNIKKITMSTFFHLCRLQNISFDIQRKIGNIFIFLDGLESGCLGMLTFNDKSKIETFIHAAEVLDFFYGKIGAKVGQGPPQQFLIIRNCINGYLNSLRKKNLALKSNKDVGTSLSEKKKRQSENYKSKQYLL